MKLKQISVPIENSRDRLYAFTRALADGGVDLRAMNLVDTGEFGEMRILVSDVAASRRILMREGIPARVEEVVAVELEDKPGRLAALLKDLMQAGVRLRYTYAFARWNSGKATLVFRFDDNDRAIEVLEEKHIRILGGADIGIEDVAPKLSASNY